MEMPKLDLSKATVTVGRTKCEVWTRVMGYHRPISHFNTGKRSEHYSRLHFSETATANSAFVREYATIK